MRLKKYQQAALDRIGAYITETKRHPDDDSARLAFYSMTDRSYVQIPELGRSPFICVKVPTGGGKTFIATHAVGLMFQEYFPERADVGLTMWFVPTDAIRVQTLKNLRNQEHDFRCVLDERFEGHVKIFDVDEAKAITRDDLANHLCIIVSTLASFRRENREGLKVFQENGALISHFDSIDPKDIQFLDTDKDGELINSLVNVVKLHSPLVILDEGHNAQAHNERRLAFRMLQALNAAFVLEFTATPREASNVLIDVSAQELKDEHMIKMPLYLANQPVWQRAIGVGVEKLNALAKVARKARKEYIRPIMLVQAEQEQVNEQRVYVDRVVKCLIEDNGISSDEIAIQTGTTRDLDGIDLSDRACRIRFVITVYALKEGWDCPFAYVLVSVSHLGAPLSVEQTIGRIMRLPYAKEHNDAVLNSGYIFSSTRNFDQAAQAVITGLQKNGYEDIIQFTGGLEIESKRFRRIIKDKNAAVPFLNVKDGTSWRALDFIADLIGDRDILAGHTPDLKLDIETETSVDIIDIGHEGELVRDRVGKMSLMYRVKEFSKEDLVRWLATRIQRGFIDMKTMIAFLSRIVDRQLKKHDLKILSIGRHALCEHIEQTLDAVINTVAEKEFKRLMNAHRLKATGENFRLPKVIELFAVARDRFSNHAYEKAGAMNREELAVAHRIDGLDTIAWWFRNPEKTGFYIQGWLRHKFYPDFIVKTKKGNCVVLEYKGEHLATGEDSEYKKAIGMEWEKLSGKGYAFKWVEKKSVDTVMNAISKI